MWIKSPFFIKSFIIFGLNLNSEKNDERLLCVSKLKALGFIAYKFL